MEKETLLKYLNKKVKVQLKNNNIYTLTIKQVSEFDIFAVDKYGNDVCISSDDISVIENGGAQR